MAPISLLGKTTVLALLLCSAISLSAQTYDAYADFNLGQNPNGVWSYGWASNGGTDFHSCWNYLGACGMTGWYDPAVPILGILRLDNPTPTPCYTAIVLPNYVFIHPGPNGESPTLRFTAPANGSFTVTMGAIGFDYSYPTTTDVHLRKNGVDLYVINVASYNNLALHTEMVVLSAGDTLDLVAGFGNGSYFGDATGLKFNITAACALPASTQTIGVGCGGAPVNPTIQATLPVLGSTMTISIDHAPANAYGQVFAGFVAAQPFLLPSGCPIWIDPASAFFAYEVYPDALGHWEVTQAVPFNPSLLGYVLALQAYFVPAPSSFGYALTNTLALTCGC